jgi:hypothetical protein
MGARMVPELHSHHKRLLFAALACRCQLRRYSCFEKRIHLLIEWCCSIYAYLFGAASPSAPLFVVVSTQKHPQLAHFFFQFMTMHTLLAPATPLRRLCVM